MAKRFPEAGTGQCSNPAFTLTCRPLPQPTSVEKRGHSLDWISINKPSTSRNPMGLSCKPSELGLSPEGSGEVQGKGVTWPGLFFRTISVAAVKWLEVSRVGVALLGRLRSLLDGRCWVSQSKAQTMWVGRHQTNEIIYLKAHCQKKFFLISAWLSKCITVDYRIAITVRISGF